LVETVIGQSIWRNQTQKLVIRFAKTAKAVFHNPNKRTISMTDLVIFQKSPMSIEVEEGKTYFWCACGKSAKMTKKRRGQFL
jgi:hypothetical protein